MKICYHKTTISSYQGDMIIFKKDKPDVRSLLSTMQQCAPPHRNKVANTPTRLGLTIRVNT